jgi:hypothetical protein
MGIFKLVSTSGKFDYLCTAEVASRIVKNMQSLEEKFKKKSKAEERYYHDQKEFVQEL